MVVGRKGFLLFAPCHWKWMGGSLGIGMWYSITPICDLSSTIFSVFMWRNHIPKLNSTFPSQVLVSSEKRPYRSLTFHVSAWQGSTYCNRACSNFQAFTLRDMKIATREGYHVGQKMSYHRLLILLVFANWTVLALEETFLSMCRSSRAIIFRFNSKTQWQMFLLHCTFFTAAMFVSLRRTLNMASPYKAL